MLVKIYTKHSISILAWLKKLNIELKRIFILFNRMKKTMKNNAEKTVISTLTDRRFIVK
jgi:hypothetical protein